MSGTAPQSKYLRNNMALCFTHGRHVFAYLHFISETGQQEGLQLDVLRPWVMPMPLSFHFFHSSPVSCELRVTYHETSDEARVTSLRGLEVKSWWNQGKAWNSRYSSYLCLSLLENLLNFSQLTAIARFPFACLGVAGNFGIVVTTRRLKACAQQVVQHGQ